MLSTFHHKNNSKGFTVIELMVVVIIIGILVMFGVNNYSNYVAKARQAEAKTNLAGLYTAEILFYGQYGGYTGDFRDIGFLIEGKRLQYDLGFAGPGWYPPTGYVLASSTYCAPRTAYNTEVSACAVGPKTIQASVAFQPATASVDCGAGMDPSITGFRATAIGASNGAVPDVWTIDQLKQLCHNQEGR